ncbi:MAG: cell division protein FtsA [Spirochaetales bacterium]|nr:cell division protein FtsA [Spirochaetales bacterium]
MPVDDLIVGLDIGTTKICAVIGEYTDTRRIEIVGIGTAPSDGLRKGVVINIESTLKAVTKAIEAAEMMSGREVSSVITGIAGAHVEGINSRGVVAVSGRDREINEEDIRRVIDAARAVVIPMDREVLHVIPQEFVVDDQGGIKNPLDMIGIRLEAEVHIITGSVTSAQNLLKCVNRAGFRVEDIVLESIASSRAVLSEEEKELGVLMIDLGGGTTDVLVFVDGSPYHTDVVAVGGEQVTSDISIVLKTPSEFAEKLKKESGCCYMPLVDPDEEIFLPGVGGWPSASIPRAELCKIIQPRMAEIFSLIRDKMIKKGYLNHLRGGVVLTGGGSMLPGAAELAKEIFGVPARIGYPFELGGLVSEYKNPMYSTAVGLIIYGNETASKDGEMKSGGRRGKEGLGRRFRNWMKEFF